LRQRNFPLSATSAPQRQNFQNDLEKIRGQQEKRGKAANDSLKRINLILYARPVGRVKERAANDFLQKKQDILISFLYFYLTSPKSLIFLYKKIKIGE